MVRFCEGTLVHSVSYTGPLQNQCGCFIATIQMHVMTIRFMVSTSSSGNSCKRFVEASEIYSIKYQLRLLKFTYKVPYTAI